MVRHAAILCLCALFALVSIGVADAQAGDWGSIARSAPPDTNVLIIVEHASAPRRGESGDMFATLVAAALPLTTTSNAWKTLADLLKMPSDHVFDALLGQRAIYYGRSRKDGSFQWAIQSEVRPKTAFKLLNRLGAKPKEIKHGHPIALIENGRFEITSTFSKRSATLIFGPRRSDELIADVLARKGAADLASIRDDDDFSRAARLAPRDANAFVFFRSHNNPANWFSATAQVSSRSIEMRLSASIREAPHPRTPFSTAQWRRFSEGSLLAMIEPFAVNELPLGSLLDRLGAGDLKDAPLPLEGRVALNVSQPRPGKLTLTAGVETSNIDLLAGIGDIALASVAANLMSSSDADQDVEPLDTLSGAFPEAMRSIALTRKNDTDVTAPNPLGEGDLTLVWSYQTLQGRSDRRGWGVISNNADAYKHAAKSLTTPTHDPDNANKIQDAVAPFSFYSAKPARLIEALARANLIGQTPTPLVQSLRLIDSIQSTTTFHNGLLRGDATIVLARTPKK